MATVSLPIPPVEYDRRYFELLLSKIEMEMQHLENPGFAVHAKLRLTQLSTSSAGLRSGDVWVDTGAGNVLKMVP